LLAELPGFGKSNLYYPDGTIKQYTALTLKLINAAGIDRFVIGGHSIGGMMAIEMLDHAEDRLDGIITSEGWSHYSVEKQAFHGLKNQTLTAEQLALRTYYGELGRDNKWSEADEKRFNKIWIKWEKGLELLKRAEVPILQFWGDRGLKERPSRDSMLIPHKENIRIEWVEKGGHSLLVQVPELMGKAIAEFMNEVRRG
jgi:pimeloyl-ACP methyl ester carboxylesterase